MAVERTLSIIKPDVTKRNLTGEIGARFIEAREGPSKAHHAFFTQRPFASSCQ
jgi:hypothetical protein